MAKNNYLINQMKNIKKREKELDQNIDVVLPSVYAAIALALHRSCGTTADDIRYIFAESQRIWYESLEKDIDMIQMCEDETGIEVRNNPNE